MPLATSGKIWQHGATSSNLRRGPFAPALGLALGSWIWNLTLELPTELFFQVGNCTGKWPWFLTPKLHSVTY